MPAFWYRTQWLLTIPDQTDKTFFTKGKHEVHIVESWESPASWAQPQGGSSGGTTQPVGSTTRDIHAYSSAPEVELLVNGKSQGSKRIVPMKQGPGSYAEWLNVTWETGTITVNAKDATGKVVATDSRHTLGAAAKLDLTIDAPSKATGTGEALLLDGHDAALLRAAVVDSSGRCAILRHTLWRVFCVNSNEMKSACFLFVDPQNPAASWSTQKTTSRSEWSPVLDLCRVLTMVTSTATSLTMRRGTPPTTA